MGAVEDRFLDVGGQQGQAQDPRGVAGAGDALGRGEFLDAFVLAPGQPAVPPVGPDQGIEQGHVRVRCRPAGSAAVPARSAAAWPGASRHGYWPYHFGQGA